MRRVVGSRLALGVRICGDELIEGGTTIDDAVEVARLVEDDGRVDYINTSIGVATASLFMIEASMHIPPGLRDVHPSAIRKAVELPVIGVGRFKDPLQAERALAEGHCNLVGVVRGQIADADLPPRPRPACASSELAIASRRAAPRSSHRRRTGRSRDWAPDECLRPVRGGRKHSMPY